LKTVLTEGSSDFEAKKSHFLGSLVNVKTEEEALGFIQAVRRKERDARHHCFAFRVGDRTHPLERFSDDGEPQGTAGKPMLELLKAEELYDVCLVVTRYFGGTLLGTGGLLRAYTASAKEAIEAAETAELEKGSILSFSCRYDEVGGVKRFCSEKDLFILQEDYGEACSLSLLCPEDRTAEARKYLTELSRGSIEPEEEPDVLFYRKGRPVLYDKNTCRPGKETP